MKKHRTPPLNSLRAFEAAARHGSFVQAATELNLTAAAISHRIKELESALGVALFRRMPRGVTLTDAGRRYQERVAVALEIIERATADVDQATVAGPLRVSTPTSFARFWLVPRLSGLARRFPELELTVTGENRLADLRGDQADIGVRFGAGNYPGLVSEFMLADAVTVLGPEAGRADTVFEEGILLEDYQVGADEPWMGWAPWLQEAGVRVDSGPRFMRFSDSGLTLQACQDGAGICVSRLSLAWNLVQTQRLRALFPWRSTEFSYYFVVRPANAENPRVLAFRTWLSEEIDAYVEQVKEVLDLRLRRADAGAHRD